MKEHETEKERAARYERGDIEISPDAYVLEDEEAARSGRELMTLALHPNELKALNDALTWKEAQKASQSTERRPRRRLTDTERLALNDPETIAAHRRAQENPEDWSTADDLP